jgi:hypothetical protein
METLRQEAVQHLISIDRHRRLATIQLSPALSYERFRNAMEEADASLLSLDALGPWAALIELSEGGLDTRADAGDFLRAFRGLVRLGSLTAVAWVQSGTADSDLRFHEIVQASLQAELPNRRFRCRDEAVAWIQSLFNH